MKKCILFLTAFVFLILGTGIKSALAAEKIGYVDLKRVFDNYDKTKTFDSALEKQGQQYKADRDKKVADISALQKSLEILGAKEKEKKQAEIDKKIQELRDFDAKKQEDLNKETSDKMKTVLEDIDGVIRGFAKKEGYTLIFDLRFMVYAQETMDITDKIIELLKNKK